jgi:hypothetical protein
MGATDGVLGHFSVLNGKSYQALLPESSPLFVAVVTNDVEALSKELSTDPGIALRVYNVLEWSSDGSKPEQTDSSSISVKLRSLLHVAALAGAQGVAQLLLSRGADPLAKSSDGNTPATVRLSAPAWQHSSFGPLPPQPRAVSCLLCLQLARLGEEKPGFVALQSLLENAAAAAENSTAGATPNAAGVSAGVPLDVLASLQATSLKPDSASPVGYNVELSGVPGANQVGIGCWIVCYQKIAFKDMGAAFPSVFAFRTIPVPLSAWCRNTSLTPITRWAAAAGFRLLAS